MASYTMVLNVSAISYLTCRKFDLLTIGVMSNINDADIDFALARPVIFGPPFAVIGLMVILLIVAVLLFARNRQARIARLRERI